MSLDSSLEGHRGLGYDVRMRRVLAIVSLCLGLLALPAAGEEFIGQPSFPNLTLSTLDGSGSVTIESFRGRPVLLTFWASWCGPCRVELPELRELYGELVGDGFVLLTVNVDNSPIIAERFLAKLGVKVPVYRMLRRDIIALEINALPTNILLDHQGRVVMATAGYTQDMPGNVRRLVGEMDGASDDGGENTGR